MPDKPILHTSVSAALLMIAREILPELDWPSTDALLARLQAGRTQAYTMASRLREVLAELHGKPGRPPQPDGYSEDKLMPVARATLDYLMRHPGACSAHQERCCWRSHEKIHLEIVRYDPPRPKMVTRDRSI